MFVHRRIVHIVAVLRVPPRWPHRRDDFGKWMLPYAVVLGTGAHLGSGLQRQYSWSWSNPVRQHAFISLHYLSIALRVVVVGRSI
jgi:hypothetical protein